MGRGKGSGADKKSGGRWGVASDGAGREKRRRKVAVRPMGLSEMGGRLR